MSEQGWCRQFPPLSLGTSVAHSAPQTNQVRGQAQHHTLRHTRSLPYLPV